MSVTVRPVRSDELARAAEICVAAYHADGMVEPGDGYAVVLADTARRAREAELLVAVDDDGQLLGTVTVCRPGSPLAEVSRAGELEFRMLAVDPRARGRGVGGRLVRAVLDRARAERASRVVLCTLADRQGAQRIYRRLGFRPMPERDWRPNDRIELVAFGCELTSPAQGRQEPGG